MALILQVGVVDHFYVVLLKDAHHFEILFEPIFMCVLEQPIGIASLGVDLGSFGYGTLHQKTAVLTQRKRFFIAVYIKISNQQNKFPLLMSIALQMLSNPLQQNLELIKPCFDRKLALELSTLQLI